LAIAEEAGLLVSREAIALRENSEEVSRMLYALRSRIRND
jgi:hypothetical protein